MQLLAQLGTFNSRRLAFVPPRCAAREVARSAGYTCAGQRRPARGLFNPRQLRRKRHCFYEAASSGVASAWQAAWFSESVRV